MSARIEAAIAAARAVAASQGAAACRDYNKGTAGTWTEQDEAWLRQGKVRIWNLNRRAYEWLEVDEASTSSLAANAEARARLLDRCAEARDRMGTR